MSEILSKIKDRWELTVAIKNILNFVNLLGALGLVKFNKVSLTFDLLMICFNK